MRTVGEFYCAEAGADENIKPSMERMTKKTIGGSCYSARL
jgi:hypothetical protein